MLLGIWSVLGAIEGSFHASVTNWAVDVATRTGEVPEFYEPLRSWLNSELQTLHMLIGLIAMALFGWGALHTGLVPIWIGWAALVWSLLSFPVYYLFIGAPLILIVPPIPLGIGLLR